MKPVRLSRHAEEQRIERGATFDEIVVVTVYTFYF